VKVLHYHRHITEGGQLRPTDKGSPLNDVIDQVNRVVESRAGRPTRRAGAQLLRRKVSRMARLASSFTS
jgi:hypothetical protein